MTVLLLLVAVIAEKPAVHVLMNKSKDIYVVSEKEETIQDYFGRQRVVVGSLRAKETEKLLETKKVTDNVFLHYASHNDNPQLGSTFGVMLKIAPMSVDVAKMVKDNKPDGMAKPSLTLVLRRDDKDEGLYHVVGYTARTSVGFFDDGKKNETDGFSQKDLRFKKAQ